jgi:hypothetical protein
MFRRRRPVIVVRRPGFFRRGRGCAVWMLPLLAGLLWLGIRH